jgi:hypothetical protein
MIRKGDLTFILFLLAAMVGTIVVVATGWDPTPDRSEERSRERVAECHDLGGVVLYDSLMLFDGCKVRP